MRWFFLSLILIALPAAAIAQTTRRVSSQPSASQPDSPGWWLNQARKDVAKIPDPAQRKAMLAYVLAAEANCGTNADWHRKLADVQRLDDTDGDDHFSVWLDLAGRYSDSGAKDIARECLDWASDSRLAREPIHHKRLMAELVEMTGQPEDFESAIGRIKNERPEDRAEALEIVAAKAREAGRRDIMLECYEMILTADEEGASLFNPNKRQLDCVRFLASHGHCADASALVMGMDVGMRCRGFARIVAQQHLINPSRPDDLNNIIAYANDSYSLWPLRSAMEEFVAVGDNDGIAQCASAAQTVYKNLPIVVNPVRDDMYAILMAAGDYKQAAVIATELSNNANAAMAYAKAGDVANVLSTLQDKKQRPPISETVFYEIGWSLSSVKGADRMQLMGIAATPTNRASLFCGLAQGAVGATENMSPSAK